MMKDDDAPGLLLRLRPSVPVSLRIPTDTMDTVRRIAATRDMTPEALLKLYIGQGLRQDAALSITSWR